MSLPTSELERLFSKIEETNRNVKDVKRHISVVAFFLTIMLLAISWEITK